MKKVIKTKNAPIPIGPYVQGIDINDMIITSGQIPINPLTNEIPKSMYDQVSQTLNNIKAIIEFVGLKVSNIVKTTIFTTNMDEFRIINSAYEKFFTENNAIFPARSCIGVSRLPNDVKVEIEVIAVRNKS